MTEMLSKPEHDKAALRGGEETAHLPASILADSHPTTTHCGIALNSLYSRAAITITPLVIAGAALFGWRALGAAGIVVTSTMAGMSLWHFVGQRGRSVHWGHGLFLSLLLAMLMPAELARENDSFGVGYTLLIAAGLTLATLYWLLGGLGSRLHPAALTALLLIGLFPAAMTPGNVLTRKSLFKGDLLQAMVVDSEPGLNPRPLPTIAGMPMSLARLSLPAIRTTPASGRLTDFTRGRVATDGTWISLDALLRDRLPPLEDLVVGGDPAPLGLGSLGAVLFGGLLMVRTGIRWRTPALIILVAMACFITFRLPLVVTNTGPVYRWLAIRSPGVTWASLITFAFYQLAAGPLVFTAFFLAPAGASSPMSRPGETIYAILIGVAAAAAQLYISVPAGPLMALTVVSLLAPIIDRAFLPRPLL